MVDEKTIKAVEAVLIKGDRVELIPVKDGVKVVRVRREEVKSAMFMQSESLKEVIKNHDCKKDCNLLEKCRLEYLNGSVIKCLYFGNGKNFGDLKK